MRKRTSTSKTPDMQPAVMHESDVDMSSEGRLSRRHFLTSSAAGVVAGAIVSEVLAGMALAANRKAKSSWPRRQPRRPYLAEGRLRALARSKRRRL